MARMPVPEAEGGVMDDQTTESQQALAKVIEQFKACGALITSVQDTAEGPLPDFVRSQAAVVFSSTAVVARVMAQRYAGTWDPEEAAEVLSAAAAATKAMAKIVPLPGAFEAS